MRGGCAGFAGRGGEKLNPRGTRRSTSKSPPCRMERDKGGAPRMVPTALEHEQVHQISDGGSVQRDVGIALGGDWVGQVVAAAIAYRSQVPIGFDEFQD